MNAAVSLMGKVLPATVHIRAEIPESHPSSRILGTERMGTGTIIDADGLVLTVNYVVLGAPQVRVTLLDQRSYVAEVVHHDFASGLALVRLPDHGLPALSLRRLAGLALGEETFIVASVGEGSARVSNGAVSYIGPFDANWEYVLDRAVMTTAMNPGLGGGPLLDGLGQVIGVVSLNLNEIGRFSLVVPAEYYLEATDRFRTPGRPAGAPGRAWLGIFSYAMKEHVVIAGLLPGGPGEQAGLKAGDVILAVDGDEVRDRRTFYQLLWRRRPGDEVTLEVFRGRQVQTVRVASGDIEAFFA